MPADATQKTVKVATWVYRNTEGKRRRAWFGDVIEVTDEELARGDAAGAFDQPPAGPVDTPFIAKGVLAKNLAGALTDVETRVVDPVGDDGLAVLHHDVQSPTAVAEPPVAEDADSAAPKPDAEAKKPELVQWIFDNVAKADDSDYTKSELNKLKVGELRAIVDSVED